MDREQQRAAARAAAALVAKPVKVPFQLWGGDIWIRRVTIAQALEARTAVGDDPSSLAKQAASRICDEGGTLTFDAGSDEDLQLLLGQGVAFLIELTEAIQSIDSPKKASTQSESS